MPSVILSGYATTEDDPVDAYSLRVRSIRCDLNACATSTAVCNTVSDVAHDRGCGSGVASVVAGEAGGF